MCLSVDGIKIENIHASQLLSIPCREILMGHMQTVPHIHSFLCTLMLRFSTIHAWTEEVHACQAFGCFVITHQQSIIIIGLHNRRYTIHVVWLSLIIPHL